MKRILSFLLITLLFATTAWSAKTAQAIWTEGNTTLTFTYEEPVSVGSTYNGQKVTNVWSGTAFTSTQIHGPGWIDTVEGSLTKVVFNSSFKNVKPTSCSFWFEYCSKLTTITGISNLTTTNVTNMKCMFRGCSSLTSLNLSSFNTAKVDNMLAMFRGCSSLTSLNLSSFNTNNVTCMESMFNGCSSLTSLNLSSFNTANVDDMYAMFEGCSSLTSLNLNSFNTNNVTEMQRMFWGCSSLTSLNLSSFTTAKVTNMESMFAGCSVLTSLNLSSFNTTNVTNMSEMFYDCKNLSSLTLGSNFKTNNVTSMSYMFYGCENLSSLTLGSNFKTDNVKYMSYMFYGCKSLSNLNLSNLNTANVTNMMSMFWGCEKLSTITLGSNFKTNNVTNMSTMFYGCKSLSNLNLSNLNTANVTNIMGMFWGCEKLSTLTLGSNFNTNNVTNMSTMFYGCESLSNLNLSNLNTANVTNMMGMFWGCEKLSTLTLGSNFKTNNVTNMRYMFYGCKSFSSLNLSNLNTANVTDMQCMFYGCSSLTSLNLSSFNTANVTNMSGMFNGCKNLSSLTFGSNFKTNNVTDMSYMFLDCKSISSLNLNINTTNVTNMSYMFGDCEKLSSLTLGSNFKTNNVTNMSGMFYGCSSLTLLNLSSFNTAKVDNMLAMFYSCTSLKNLDLSSFNTSSVTNYGSMFSNVPAQCFVYMPTGVTDKIKSQRSKNLVLKNGSAWTCANCEMTPDTEYDIWYQFKAATLTVTGSSATAFCLYKDGAMYSTVTSLANVTIPKGKDKISATFPAMAIWTEGNTTLTFLAADKYKAGDTYNSQTITNVWKGTAITASANTPAWLGTVKGTVTKVVFDASFKYVKPIKCLNWFRECGKLATVANIGNFNTSEVTTMQQMFRDCTSLTSLNLSTFNTQKVTTMRSMFYGCTGLTSLNLSSFNTATTTNIGYMFCNCSKLTSIDVSKFNTANVTAMDGLFYGCAGVTSLDLSSINTQKVTTMVNMFRGCSKLTSLDLSKFNTAAVSDMTSMFFGCSGLTSLDLAKFNTAKVTTITNMFRGCSKLMSIDASNFSYSALTTYATVFNSVPDLCFVYMPAGMPDDLKSQKPKDLVLRASATSSTYTCTNCEMKVNTAYNVLHKFTATKLTVQGSDATNHLLYNNGEYYSGALNANTVFPEGSDKLVIPTTKAIWTADNNTLTFLDSNTTYKAGDSYNGQTVTNVWYGSEVTASANTPAWLSAVKGTVTKVVFAASFKNVKPTKCLNWFHQCGKLATITGIGNLNTSEVTTMQQMFRDCSSLTSLNLSTFDTQKVTTTRCMFYGCTGLTSLNLSSFNTAATTNMGYMFCNCSKLTNIDVSKFNTANVTAMEGLFYGCARVASLDVSNFNTTKVTTMKDMFRGCSKLASIDASNFSYDALTTYTDMFTSVPDLCFVYMPAGMPDDLKSQKAKNLVLRASTTSSTYTCASCEMKVNTTYNVLHKFTATKLTVQGSDVTSHLLYNNGEYYSGALSANTVFPEGSDNLVIPTTKAIWTVDNNTLTFLDSNTTYKAGDSYNGQTVTNVWYGAEVTATSGTESAPDAPGWQEIVAPTLTEVVFDSSFKNVKPKSFGKWFQNCSKLTTFTGMENLVTTDCVNMSYMFDGCSSLTSLDLSHFNTANTTANAFRFLYVFRNCSSLKSLDLSNFNNVSMMWGQWIEGVFYGCSSLEMIDFSSFNAFAVAVNRTDLFFKDVPQTCFVFAKNSLATKLKGALKVMRPINLVLKNDTGDGSWSCDNCVLTDGATLNLPYGFTALGGVKYERTIPANTGEASAVFLPYNSMIPEGVTAYTLKTSEQKHLSKDKVMFEPVNGSVMEAYTPYLIINRGADLTDLNTTTDTQVLPTTTAPAEKSFGDLRFTGTIQTHSNEEAVAMQAYSMQDGNQWKKVTASSAEGIPAYRAFLVSPSFSASTLKAVFPLPGDANDDGKVTVTDIAVVVNEILQLPNTDISTDNADANSDGQITVTDIGVIVDMILGNTAASSRKLQGLEPQ